MYYWYKRKDGYIFATEPEEASNIHGKYEFLGASDGVEYTRIIRESEEETDALRIQEKKVNEMLAKIEEQELLILDEKKLDLLGKKKDVLKKKLEGIKIKSDAIYVDAKKKAQTTELAKAVNTPPDMSSRENYMTGDNGSFRQMTHQEEQKFIHD